MRLTRGIIITAMFVAAATAASWGQSAGADTGKLAKMRGIYEKEIAKLKLPILAKLSKDLATLETQLTKQNKLEEAVAARAERRAVDETIAALKSGSSAVGKRPSGTPARPGSAPVNPSPGMKEFGIEMGKASLQGSLTRNGAAITNWISTSCLATWSGGRIVPGKYDIYIDYDTNSFYGGGELKFMELGQEFHCSIPKVYRRTTMKVGTFKLGTALGFSIRANSKNRYGILDLYGITFRPSKS